MPNRSADIVFQLIHSLEKAEKRNFKLYIKRNSANDDLKIIELFDALDKLDEYDESLLLKKLPTIKKPQLANVKSHLYRQVLASLRVIKISESVDLQLHEQLDYARILYHKGLYYQSLKILEKVKELSASFNQDSFLIQAISLEKKIETLHITRSMQNRAEQLSAEADEVHHKRLFITALSNLALKLYSWYVKYGHARNASDERTVKKYLYDNLPANSLKLTGFYERLYYYQSFCWYGFICQDFLKYYRYTQKWVNLFHEQPFMIDIEPGHYIKGMHNLMNAHFDLRNYKKFEEVLDEFSTFAQSKIADKHINNRVQTFVYLMSARINQHLITGTFNEGLALIPYTEKKLANYTLFLDRHRVLVFNYKIATLYFGAGNYGKCVDYLRKIINDVVDLRQDLQCYARLLHLIAHYELGNTEIIEHLVKSVYRFMAKMENLSVVEEEILKYLQNSFYISVNKLQPEFKKLLDQLKKLETNRYETRAFAYLDVVSWLESKVNNEPLQKVIHDKFLKSRRR
ncbi:MAG TPA: hypothetical protein PKC62_08425 [Ferruginibacter sp.]|nr:hypothetical protein [Bacteroidota bacterium]MBS1926123.1 hypothetical protein [Bacteroidota bacterium]HMT96697.1 hypothetical protein [Ferruginibacter sp.]